MIHPECPFCREIDDPDGPTVYIKPDNYPVSRGHMLIIPNQHYETYFDLPDEIKEEMWWQLELAKAEIEDHFQPDGFNVGFNCGTAAGQTVMHVHMHIIPRYKGDMDNPRGGVRGCIPDKRLY